MLVERARPLPCMFHWTFGQTPNLGEAVGEIINCGFKVNPHFWRPGEHCSRRGEGRRVEPPAWGECFIYSRGRSEGVEW